MPADVKTFTSENIASIKEGREFERNGKLREAICMAIVVAKNRLKEDNVIDLAERRRMLERRLGRGRGRLRGRNRLIFLRRVYQKAEEAL